MKNNITKVITCFFIVILSICSLAVISFAHSGRTDGSGGHYDHDAGTYHYHHGYDEHYHTNGVCPYNFNDKTNHSNEGNYLLSDIGNEICVILLAILLIFAPYIIIQVVKKIIKKAQSIPKSELEFIIIISTIIMALIVIMYLSDIFQNA